MSFYQINQEQQIKEQYSQIFTLKSIQSGDQQIQIIINNQQIKQKYQINTGHWTNKEHIKYIMFLQYFSDLFALKHNKKLWKIFTVMSNFIKTRNSSQCRSHHQKTQRKYFSIQSILHQEKIKYHNYQLQYEKMKKNLKKLPIKSPQQKKNQRTSVNLPSIKVLQQDIQLKFIKNIASDKQITGTQLLSQKTLKGSKLLTSTNYPIFSKNSKNKKQISSQCSIQMQYRKQYQLPPPIQRKNIKWATLEPKFQEIQQVQQHLNQNSISQKKKTNDTYINNKVKTKKLRSSMPFFNDYSLQNRLEQFKPQPLIFNNQIVKKPATSPRKSKQQQADQISLNNYVSQHFNQQSAVSQIQYGQSNFTYDQKHPDLFFYNADQQSIIFNKLEQIKPMMKRRSKQQSVFQHQLNQFQYNYNNMKQSQNSQYLNQQKRVQKPEGFYNKNINNKKYKHSNFREYRQNFSIQQDKQQQNKQQNLFPYIRQNYNQTAYNNSYLNSYHPDNMYQFHYPLYYTPVYYPSFPINDSTYSNMYYELKNWFQFFIYFWVWKCKMNQIYMQ